MNLIKSGTRCTCCGLTLPIQDARVSEEVASQVRELRRKAKPIEAVAELRRLTGMSLRDAKFWADHCGEPIGRVVQTGPCPYCGEELRTDIAKQCRHCLRDWHDPENVTLLGSDQKDE